MSQQVNNKRIAKNTLLLYFRMLFTMAISLYTSRVVLATLGVEDYGIYNVVGGIVIILSFLNNAMAGATQRFLNVELGRRDHERLVRAFSTSIVIHFCVAGVILVLAETIGVWFLNSHMNISESRMVAANWVLQFSVIAFIFNVISVPYNACIIAHEKMSAFAYISVLEVVLKLVIVYFLTLTSFDRLIFYSFLIMCVSIVIRIVYNVYCKHNFEECKRIGKIDKPFMKSMLSFSGWTIFGNLGFIFHTQGIAILMNIFFGAAVNAAQGVTNQVNGVVKSFVQNFLTALNPQVVKSYAAGELDAMHRLVLQGCRMAFFLVAFFVIPLTLEAPSILGIWLKEVPEYTVIFVRLVLFLTLFDCFSGLLATAKGATGDIKVYQIVLTTIGFFHLPLSWLFFHLGYEPYYAMYVYLVIIIILQVVRIWFVCRSINLPLLRFYRNVVLRCGFSGILAAALPVYLHIQLEQGLSTTILIGITSVVTVSLTALYLGLDREERTKIVGGVLKKMNIKTEVR